MTWDVDPVFIEFGSFSLRYYTLLLCTSLLLGYLLLAQSFRRLSAPVEEAGDFLAYGFVAVLVGGRLGHVLFYDLEKAMEDPIWIIRVWTGGMESHGAIIGLSLAALWFCRRRGLSMLQLTDLLVRPLLLGGVLVRVGAFFNSDGVGRVTESSLGMRFPRYDLYAYPELPLRHPAQLYEGALYLVLFFVVTYLAPSLRTRAAGLVTAAGLGLYALARFGVEFVKEFQTLTESPLTMAQHLSLAALGVAAAIGLWVNSRKEAVGWVEKEAAEP